MTLESVGASIRDSENIYLTTDNTLDGRGAILYLIYPVLLIFKQQTGTG
ncbi:hypothetical protein PIIN_11468 [Serendipita indica DSM 11827]|uniref:Uncharacterized protein n=1 Tax=Serendipita indica (strain DSM 11827) TaxID=1109443 RepID=G4U1P8_SERID|nr:hypothetical protein PIIN_11468 [Serendipita indica DSM 11827]